MVLLHLLEELLGDGYHVPVLFIISCLELHCLINKLLALLWVGSLEDRPEEVLLWEVLFIIVREEVDETWKLLQHHRVDSRHLEPLMVWHWLLVSLGEFDKPLLLGQDLLHESE